MLTHRGWLFFITTLALLAVSLASGARSVTLTTLTLLFWFLGQWLGFSIRMRLIPGRLTMDRRLVDRHGPIKTLWARRPVSVQLTLRCHGRLSIPYIRVID